MGYYIYINQSTVFPLKNEEKNNARNYSNLRYVLYLFIFN